MSRVLDVLDERIAELSKTIKQKAGESEEAKLLMTIPGVGYFGRSNTGRDRRYQSLSK